MHCYCKGQRSLIIENCFYVFIIYRDKIYTKVVSHVLRSLSEVLAILYLQMYNFQQNHVLKLVNCFNNIIYHTDILFGHNSANDRSGISTIHAPTPFPTLVHIYLLEGFLVKYVFRNLHEYVHSVCNNLLTKQNSNNQ